MNVGLKIIERLLQGGLAIMICDVKVCGLGKKGDHAQALAVQDGEMQGRAAVGVALVAIASRDQNRRQSLNNFSRAGLDDCHQWSSQAKDDAFVELGRIAEWGQGLHGFGTFKPSGKEEGRKSRAFAPGL